MLRGIKMLKNKFIITLILIFTLLISSFSFVACGKEDNGGSDDNAQSATGSVDFGLYPQSDVTATMAANLSSYTSIKPTASNTNGWFSFKFFQNSNNETDFAWYKDIEFSENIYRAVYFSEYRPSSLAALSSEVNSYQDDNGYNTGKVYIFKFEPITWRKTALVDGKTIIVAEKMLDCKEFNSSTSNKTVNGRNIYANNYEQSSIRSWLNTSFYDTAFSESQRTLISETSVSNGAKSTNPDGGEQWNGGANAYASGYTQDKVYFLSVQEATKEEYGFSTEHSANNATRRKKPTDYARCLGVETFNDFGNWWLRSSYYFYNNFSWRVSFDGDLVNANGIVNTCRGIVPVLRVSL